MNSPTLNGPALNRHYPLNGLANMLVFDASETTLLVPFEHFIVKLAAEHSTPVGEVDKVVVPPEITKVIVPPVR